MADDRWNNRSEGRSMDRDWSRDERGRYASDRDRDRDRDYGRERSRPTEGYGPSGYESGDTGYGRQMGGYASAGSNPYQGLAAPGSFTEHGAPSSSGYSSQYGSPASPPATAWLGSSRRGGDGGYGGEYRTAEQRSFGPNNAYVQDITDGGQGRGQHLGEHRGEHRGRGPRNYTRSDERIREDVNDRLTDDAWLDAQDIDVTVTEREVTLTGTVADRRAKRRAEALAEDVSGVDNVQNNLRVRKAQDEAASTADQTDPAWRPA